MIVPILIGGYLSYQKFARIIEDQVSQVASLTITQVNDKLNLIFQRLDDTSLSLLGNEMIRDALVGDPRGNLTSEEVNKNAKKLITDIMTHDVEDISILDIHKQYSILSTSFQTAYNPWQSEWYEQIKQANGLAVWFGLSHTSYLKNVNLGHPVFGLGRAIKDLETGKLMAIMFIEVRGDVLIKELDPVKFAKTGYTYLVDNNNNIMYHPNALLYGDKSQIQLPKHSHEYVDPSKNTLLFHENLENGWHINGVVSVQELVADSIEIRNLTIWIALAAIVFAILMWYFVTYQIGRPIVNLTKLMKRSEEGDLTVRSAIIGKNEIGQLSRSFNRMIQEIDSLILRIGIEETEKKKAEIKALRYQINPHFLYNTLNSIRWMAKLKKTNEVVNAISTLVHLLEASLQRKGPFVQIGEEFELLYKYMIIQQYRYDNKIDLTIDCPQELKEIMIPQMLLQPIVENAIFHGIAPKDDGGAIRIEVRDNGLDMMINITDNGIGINPEKLPYILTADCETTKRGMTHIGLLHVHQTLQLHYGSDYGLKITSSEAGCTAILLTFSKVKGDSHVQSAVG
jgi:two-component system sensor histidine kinase YesM